MVLYFSKKHKWIILVYIKNKEYERLPIETRKKLIAKDTVEIKDLVPNPILIRKYNNKEKQISTLLIALGGKRNDEQPTPTTTTNAAPATANDWS